jgi:ferredoxin-NADP reductase
MTGTCLDLRVTATRSETSQIEAIRLARPAGQPLSRWEPGAHMKVGLPDGDERSYSLVDGLCVSSATLPPGFAAVAGTRLVFDL